MLVRLATAVVRSRRRVLVLAALFLALAGALGGGVAGELSTGGFEDPASPSARAAEVLEREFRAGAPNLALLVTAADGVDAPAAASSGVALAQRLAAEPGVTTVVSYWTSGRPPTLRSRDGSAALVLARLTGTEDEQVARVEELGAAYAGTSGALRVQVGGKVEVFRQVGDTIKRDLARAEAFALPVTAVLLVLVFGSAVAAGLPLLVGVLSILGTFLTLHVLAGFLDVSVYAVNLAVSLGLGLGIDYSLFMLTRYREELRAGRSTPDAVVETVRTAGRTVLFSALTVLLSLGALLVFPLSFLRSFAYAGISAVLFAALGALLVLPAALAALGPNIDRWDLRAALRRALRLPVRPPTPQDQGFWHRVAVTVMRRPLPLGTAVVALLVVVGLPFAGASFGLPDDRVLPRDASGHTIAETIRTQFPSNEPLALTVVATGAPDRASGPMARYATELSSLPGVARVDASTGSYAAGHQVAPPGPASQRFKDGPGSYLTVVPDGDGYGPRAEQLVHALREAGTPFGPVAVGGQAAQLVDTKASLGSQLPLALGLIATATFVLLFLFTGSVVLPVKAVVLNLLSLSATFGAMVWIFQHGHLTWLIGDPIVTGTLDTTMPILMFCVLFGLSMDYEVFLLSRIKEEWDASGDNTRAVALGLERTGRLVTAAAGLLAIVFLAFVSSDIAFIKLLGLGTALAVVVDATLVRGVLVPAFMRLAGEWNWWAPPPLRRLHERFGLSEAPPARVREPEPALV
ncbi:MAG: putative superfamily drug exporter [Frankiales bacterium]|nr:putative superfamily drug exporter [Frankiales bacterium]